MSEMVERLAAAMHERCREYWKSEDGINAKPWHVREPRDEEYREMWRDFVRAAIAAMREPNKEMLDVGYSAVDDAVDWAVGSDGEYTTVDRAGAALGAWQAMIDEALK